MSEIAERIAQNLRDAGCPEEFIAEFLRVMAEGSPEEQRRMLEKQRCRILKKLHDAQKKLECFDYLCWQLKKEREEQS